jgi:osmotically-inducible protein OsmY
MSNEELFRRINEELFWDPKVDSEAIAVSVDDGAVSLRGTVGSFREKREARKAVERLYGVTSVTNDLDVRLMTDSRRADADVRGDVLQALALDAFVPAEVEANVKDGSVTLTGLADWQFQRDEAAFVASNIVGVIDVSNLIELTNGTASAPDIAHDIKHALKRSAKLDAEGLTVTTQGHQVTLRGMVGSWPEHDEAVAAAWAAPGVTAVKDHILVAY